MLVDNHGRVIKYLRLAVTDRCNLRCFYCMPEKGLDFSPKSQLLSYEEMLRLIRILADLGIEKVRITGGEPMLRKDIVPFLSAVKKTDGIQNLSITSNGTNLLPHLDELISIGIDAVNLSLDTLSKARFAEITRRDCFDEVKQTMDALIQSPIKTKLNMVVMEEHNLDDIIPMARLTVVNDLNVRFIEEMPFNGGGKSYSPIDWDHKKILAELESGFGHIPPLSTPPSETARGYQIKGAKGTIGIIPAYTRTICGQCDRIRLTPKGQLRTCLYSNAGHSFRDMIRSGADDKQISEAFIRLVGQRAKNGFEAAKINTKKDSFESMATIGG